MICVEIDSCVHATDLQIIDGQLVDFRVDDNEIGPRLGRPGVPVPIGTATAQVRAAYQPVTSDQFTVYVELVANEQARFELSTAVYVDAAGNQTPIDRERSIGAGDITVKGTATASLVFPGAEPGGEVRFLVHPTGGLGPRRRPPDRTPLTPTHTHVGSHF